MLLMFSCIYVANSQTSTTKGREFWLAFGDNFNNPTTDVYITSIVPVTGTIEMPLIGWSQNFTVTPGITTLINVPPGNALVGADDAITDQGIHITTDECVSVFMLNNGSNTSDGSAVLPIEAVGQEYYAMSHTERSFNSQFQVVGMEANTQVEITLPVTENGHAAGVPYNITLNQGEVYQIQASGRSLGGARVRGTNNKDFAVFSGNECTDVGGCTACDHLVEQMFPLSSWGTEYVTAPYRTRTEDMIKILTGPNAASITINGGAPINLGAGQEYEYKTGVPNYIVSDQPISVGQFSLGQSCDNAPADPFYIIISPVDQTLKTITFNAFTSNVITSYYLNVVTETANTGTVLLDGANVPGGSFNTVPSNPTYSYAQLDIAQGDHTISAQDGIIAYVYGYGNFESYGYAAGANLIVPFQVDFSPDTAICPGETVQFSIIGDTTGINSYEWDFGDGSSASGVNPSHQFSSVGLFEVKLVYKEAFGCFVDTSFATVEVAGATLSIDGPTHLCQSQAITLNAIAPSALSYTWNTGATTPSITVTPTFPSGKYWVDITSNTCSNSDTLELLVEDNTAAFTFVNECEGDSTAFTNTSSNHPQLGYTYTWDFDDGSTDTLASPMHLYNAAGDYDVQLTITSDSACTATTTQSVSVDPNPVADFTVSDICQNETLTPVNQSTIASGTMNFVWDYGDNTPLEVGASPPHDYSNDGSYTISLVATSDNGCTDTTDQPININEVPIVDFSATTACIGEATQFTDLSQMNNGNISTWSWDFGDNNTSTLSAPSHQYTAPGTYTVVFIAEAGNGCGESITKNIVVNELPAFTETISQVSCNGFVNGSIDLTMTAGIQPYTYTWNNNSNTQNINGLDVGDYSVTVIDDNGCVDSNSYTITEPTALQLTLQATDAICFGDANGTASASASGGTTPIDFTWSNGSTDSIITDFTAGQYTLEIEDANGCLVDSTITIGEPAEIQADVIMPEPMICGQQVQLQATVFSTEPNLQYQWTPSAGLDCDTCLNPIASPIGTTEYDFVATNSIGCPARASTTVTITSDKIFYVPNAFSPNGDGVNDIFFVNITCVDEFSLKVFDRWGQLVHTTTSPEPIDGWNGVFRDEISRPGVYVYKVDVTYLNGEQAAKSGSVTLIR